MVFSGIIQQQQQRQQQSREFPREKKLDLNAPLMSVRRHQLEASSSDDEQVQQHQQQQQQQQQQAYPQQQNVQRWGPDRKSEVCCSSSPQASKGDDDDGVACWGSLRSPGAVPFVWERTPGRPKFESAAYTNSDFAPGRNSCSSPSLPPGRTWAKSPSPSRPVFTTDSYRRRQKDAAVADVKAQQQQQQQQLRQKHRNKLPPQVLCNDTTTTSSRRKHAQRQQLGELFKNRGARSFTSESDEQQLDQVEEDAFSDAPHSDSITLDPPAYSKSIPADDPAARDFILRRFLPAAKAMADESASSTPFASPLVSSFSPRKQAKSPHPQQATLSSLISHPSTRDQASPSVERIQKYQYKFASSIPRSSDKTSSRHDDFFALKACGFFSFALRHFRPQYPSSRLRRSSDRANNRFAADDFHTSIFVKKVNGGLTIRHESEAASEAETEDDRKSPGLKKNRSDRSELNSPLTALKPPKSFDKPEKFYDCNATFSSKRSPVSSQNPEKASYYRGSMSPFPERHETKGFLGLPENYKPPEDPYRNVGYSPPVLCRNANQRAAAEPVLPATLAKRLENNMLADADVKVASSPIASHRNQAANLAVRNGETRKEVHWSRPTVVITPDQFERPPPLQSPARNHVPSSPTGGASPLLPPKSPAQSWLWKTLPQSPSTVPQEKKNAKWEATVKSRKLRPGHLRYSEENALQQCEY